MPDLLWRPTRLGSPILSLVSGWSYARYSKNDLWALRLRGVPDFFAYAAGSVIIPVAFVELALDLGFSLGVSWRILVGVVSLTGVLAGYLILKRPGPGQQTYPDAIERTHWRKIKAQATAIVSVPRFWLYYFAMFLAGGGEFCLTFWSASHIQLHYGASPWSGGLGVAFFATGMTLARTGWGYLIHQHGLKKLILHSAAAGTLVCLFLPSAESIWVFFALIFLAGIATGPFWPSIQSYSADRLPGTDPTMLMILLSCAGVPGCGFFTYLMGYLGNQSGSLTTAFYLVPASYALLGILIGVDRLHSKGLVITEST